MGAIGAIGGRVGPLLFAYSLVCDLPAVRVNRQSLEWPVMAGVLCIVGQGATACGPRAATRIGAVGVCVSGDVDSDSPGDFCYVVFPRLTIGNPLPLDGVSGEGLLLPARFVHGLHTEMYA